MHNRVALTTFLVLTLWLALGNPALATDNVTPYHQHDRQHHYRINSSFPSDWKPAVREAGTAWSDRTRLKFIYDGETSSKDPTGSTKIVWRGGIPGTWQGNCPPDISLACTRWLVNPYNHIADVDTVFNSSISMGTSDVLCFLSHGYDVQTIALHEFGHWGVLKQTTDRAAAMFAFYQGCRRTPLPHDIDSMNWQYRNH